MKLNFAVCPLFVGITSHAVAGRRREPLREGVAGLACGAGSRSPAETTTQNTARRSLPELFRV